MANPELSQSVGVAEILLFLVMCGYNIHWQTDRQRVKVKKASWVERKGTQIETSLIACLCKQIQIYTLTHTYTHTVTKMEDCTNNRDRLSLRALHLGTPRRGGR